MEELMALFAAVTAAKPTLKILYAINEYDDEYNYVLIGGKDALDTEYLRYEDEEYPYDEKNAPFELGDNTLSWSLLNALSDVGVEVNEGGNIFLAEKEIAENLPELMKECPYEKFNMVKVEL